MEEFAAGPMGAGCEILPPAAVAQRVPVARCDGVAGALFSPHEVRVEARAAIPALARYLAAAYGVTFVRGAHVRAVEPPVIETSAGRYAAELAVVCPGTDLLTLFPDTIARHRPRLCKLHMLRLAPQPASWRLGAAVMMDLTLVRYGGFADCPSLAALRRRLEATEAETLAHGIHLIVVQSADGSLVVGDSHHYDDTPDPFADVRVEALILRHAEATLALGDSRVAERWIGLYPSAGVAAFSEAPRPDTRVVMVTRGNGMSTAFALAEETIVDLLGAPATTTR